MMKMLALVAACCVLVGIQTALADGEGNSSTAVLQPAPPQQVAVPAPETCTPLRVLYARDNWRDAHPLRGELPCDAPRARARKLREGFYLYRRYRQVAPYRGFSEGDLWLKWLAVPSYIVACETRGYYGQGRWRATNGSTMGPYQFIGWPVPWPVDSARDKVAHHEMAAGLSLSNWACA